jgi:hypothetical protein
MTVNLAEKYAPKIATKFTAGSYLGGRTSTDFEFVGVKTLKIVTPLTVPENDYKRSGSNRYGDPEEMQDSVQELQMTQDKGATLTIDKGNQKDQMNLKEAGKMVTLQLNERTIPTADKYAFTQYATNAGKIVAVATPTKSNIVEYLASAQEYFDENEVPEEGRFLYINPTNYKFLKLSPEFMNLETLGTKALGKGHVGECMGFQVVRVPSNRLPANVHFIATYKESILFPFKIKDAKYHTDPPGISGDLLELRHYYDAFVVGAKAAGVYACIVTGKQQTAPTITYTGGATDTLVIASTGATEIKYTLDGTDPRSSITAEDYTAAINTSTWTVGKVITVKAIAYKTDIYPSDVITQDITVV